MLTQCVPTDIQSVRKIDNFKPHDFLNTKYQKRKKKCS